MIRFIYKHLGFLFLSRDAELQINKARPQRSFTIGRCKETKIESRYLCLHALVSKHVSAGCQSRCVRSEVETIHSHR